MQMLLLLLLLPLVRLSRSALGELEDLGELGELGAEMKPDMSDFDLDIAPQRLPRQVKTILTQEKKPHIQELSIKTTIVSRYAFTAVSCVMVNRHMAAADGLFRFRIPANAFVSNFTMLIGGRVYQSEVEPRERRGRGEKGGGAKSKNKKPGDTSGASEPEVELFQVAASIPGRSRAVFLLTYEELLQRRLGRYEHVSSLRPQQLVSRLRLEVALADGSPITHLQVLPLRSARSSTTSSSSSRTQAKPQLPVATSVKQEEGGVWRVTFNPSIIQQAKVSTAGLLGDFVIRYDVQRDAGVGDVQVLNGHFVHYFAPSNLPAVPKNVVFVIDTSASMLGKKIRQTKDALLSILTDLRPADRFNLVGFSNRVKVWQPGRLLPVTPLNIRDAKKFIFTLPTTGGTNIDGALQAGSALLRDFLSSGGGGGEPSDSVSLLVFLTDGRPTVGELQSAAILDASRSAAAGLFCIFTVGIGGDVDYQLLRRMADDNCGMMRRVPEDADAGAMLKGFYEEIGTPLLSDVQLSYGEDSALAVTQSAFATYFNGSEVVVAGRLANRSAEWLHVTVTASSGSRSVVLEADVPLRRRQAETRQVAAAVGGVNGAAVGGANGSAAALHFAEHVWAFLSVQQRLRSRLSSRGSRQRAELVGRATQLSLRYHFLTPLTRLRVERPQVLADGSMAPPTGGGASENRLPGEETDWEGEKEEEPVGKPGGQSSPAGGAAAGEVKKRPVKKSITISKTSADGDPHFVVEFPLSKLNVCFNINGEPGHVLRLVSDHRHSGVTVNGKLIGAPAPPGSHKQRRTYFGSVSIVADRPPRRAYIEVTPRKVIVDGRDRLVLPCHATAAVHSGHLSVAVVGGANVTVTLADANISFVVLLHRYKNPAPYQRDHLGFYIAQSKGLSPQTHGLLGQFLYEEVGVAEAPGGGGEPSAVLKVKERSVPVVKKTRRIYGGAHSVDCWFARNNAAKLIDGRYQDYLAPHMFDTGDGRPGGSATNGA